MRCHNPARVSRNIAGGSANWRARRPSEDARPPRPSSLAVVRPALIRRAITLPAQNQGRRDDSASRDIPMRASCGAPRPPCTRQPQRLRGVHLRIRPCSPSFPSFFSSPSRAYVVNPDSVARPLSIRSAASRRPRLPSSSSIGSRADFGTPSDLVTVSPWCDLDGIGCRSGAHNAINIVYDMRRHAPTGKLGAWPLSSIFRARSSSSARLPWPLSARRDRRHRGDRRLA